MLQHIHDLHDAKFQVRSKHRDTHAALLHLRIVFKLPHEHHANAASKFVIQILLLRTGSG